ncbi:MAG: four helix bundle suffix domain-containing protein [Bacteroidales bacterium]|nr:four helix bundle suffix domain-containing protein [Bacteroidales bacterium]MDY4142677.1 four helix bundle suffix domain-containing protein [Sodaliphilus sp.]
MNRQKQDFLQQGGIREQMSQARIAYRTNQK